MMIFNLGTNTIKAMKQSMQNGIRGLKVIQTFCTRKVYAWCFLGSENKVKLSYRNKFSPVVIISLFFRQNSEYYNTFFCKERQRNLPKYKAH